MTSHSHASSLRRLAMLLTGSLAFAQAAWADHITACDDPNTGCFDGAVLPFPGFPDDQHWGMSADQASSLGLPTLQLQIWQASDLIQVSGDFLSTDPIDSLPDPFTYTSTWTIESIAGIGLIADPYLLFRTATNHDEILGQMTSYDETEVGVTMAGSGWAIVEGDENGTPVYYLGISLGDLFELAGATTLRDVTYYLDDPNIFDVPNSDDQIISLPRLDIAVAGTLIPEPGTGLLLGLGLVLLAGASRRLH